MHFSSAVLLRLFLKPKAMISMRSRKKKRLMTDGDGDKPPEEVDAQYWAQQNAGRMDNDDDDDTGAPFDTQFINGDDTGFGNLFPDEDLDFADIGPSPMPVPEEDDDLIAATQGQTAKRARPEYVSYARQAKRVDVKRLKENIWKELDVPQHDPENDTAAGVRTFPFTYAPADRRAGPRFHTSLRRAAQDLSEGADGRDIHSRARSVFSIHI
jgi:condensin complex subunit 2